MARLTLTLLGGFQARLDAGRALALHTKKIQALLAYLALPAGREHPRDKLAALLWGDLSQGRARHSLRQALFALRPALDDAHPTCLRVDGAGIALNPDAVDVDAMSFERLVGERTAEAFAQAVELYRGDLLDGLTLQEPPFEEWLMAERERLRELALEALAGLLAAQRAAGAADAALQTGLRLIALDPLQEPVHRTLMRLYAQVGRRGSALHQYQLCVGVLRRELGVEPEKETQQLYQEILRAGRRPDTVAVQSAPAAVPSRDAPREPRMSTDIPLVGRERELARLVGALDEARRGQGRVLVVHGEAGVGKSRLVAELATQALNGGCRLLLGHCHETEQVLPFGPWLEAFRGGGVPAVTELPQAFLPRWRTELGRLLPEVTPDEAGPGASSPDRVKLFEAVIELLRHLAAQQAVVLILEDIHWADEMTLRLLTFLSHRLQSWSILVVATLRDEELADYPLLRRTQEELDREAHAARLGLVPLSHDATVNLVGLLARTGTTGADLTRLGEEIWRTSEGNAFVVVETMRAFDQGVLSSGWPEPSLPARVREAIARRLDRLSDGGQRLVAVAAVIGHEFEFGVIHRTAGLDEPEAAEGVEELVRRQVLRAAGDRFDFTHDRVREVVYGHLLAPRRKLLHRRAAETMEEFYGSELERHHLTLGHHYLAGEVWDRAVAHLRRAGIDAVGGSAYRDAVACFEEALGALHRLPDGRDTREQAADLHLHCREALNPLGELDRIRHHLQRAEVLAVALGDQRRLGETLGNLTQCFRQLGDHTKGLESGVRALRVVEAVGDFGLLVVNSQYLAQIHWALGDAVAARGLLARYVDRFEGDRLHQRFGMTGYPSVSYPALLGACLADLGEFAEGIARGEQGLRIAQDIDHPYTLAIACLWLGRVYLAKGTLDPATRLLERGLAIARTQQLGGWPRYALTAGFGYALSLSGRVAGGVVHLEEAEAQAVAANTLGRVSLFLSWLAEVYRLARRMRESAAAAERALGLARAHHERGNEALALCVAAEVAADLDRPQVSEGEAQFHRALTLADELALRPLSARCHLGLGVMYRRAGSHSQAMARLTTAMDCFRQMDMTSWIEKAAAEMRRSGRASVAHPIDRQPPVEPGLQ